MIYVGFIYFSKRNFNCANLHFFLFIFVIFNALPLAKFFNFR